jgi:hypothetical protein
MSDDQILPIVQFILTNDASIGAACDYEVHVSELPSLGDDWFHAEGENTCITLKDLSQTDQGFLGSIDDGKYLYDILFEVNILSKQQNRQSALALAKLVRKKLREHKSTAYNGDTYYIGFYVQSLVYQYDEWNRYILTVRAKDDYTE